MADRYYVGVEGALVAGGTDNWSDTEGGASGASVPGAGDTAYVGGAEGAATTLILDGDWAVGSLIVGATGAIAGDGNADRNIDVGGDVLIEGLLLSMGRAMNVFCGGSVSVEQDQSTWTSGTLTMDGTSGELTIGGTVGMGAIALVVNNNGVTSLTMTEDIAAIASVTLTAGKLADGGHGCNFTNFTYSAGTLTSTGIWTQSTGTMRGSSSFANAFGHYRVAAGATVTVAVRFTAKCVSVPVGSTLALGAQKFYVYPSANDCINIVGSVTATTGQFYIDPVAAGLVNSTPALLGSVMLYVETVNTATFTQTGRLTCGSLRVYSANVGHVGTLVATGGGAIGDIVLGHATANQSGGLSLQGSWWTITSISDGNVANLGNALAMNSAYVALSGTLDATNIAVTNAASFVQNGTVSNLGSTVLAAPIRSSGTNIATNNNDGVVNITANDSVPGSRSMMGVGV